MQEIKGMNPQTLISEIAAAQERLKVAPVIDQKQEFLNNAYPIMSIAAARNAHFEIHMLERLHLIEATIAEFLTAQESMILPELSAQIMETLSIGVDLCSQLEAFFQANSLPEKVMDTVAAYRQAAVATMSQVDEVTAEEIDDEEDDEEEAESNGANGEPVEHSDVVAEALAEAEAEAEASESSIKEGPSA